MKGHFSIFPKKNNFNVENSIKCEMKWERSDFINNSKIVKFCTPKYIFLDVGNSIKREENMKYGNKNSIFKKLIKIQTTFHQYQEFYSTPHDMVHIPARFRENTSMRVRVTIRKLNVMDRQMDGRTDRRMDGGHCNISRPGRSARNKKFLWKWKKIWPLAPDQRVPHRDILRYLGALHQRNPGDLTFQPY